MKTPTNIEETPTPKKTPRHKWSKPPNDKKKIVWTSAQYKAHQDKSVTGTLTTSTQEKASKVSTKPKKQKVNANQFTKLVEGTLNSKLNCEVWRNNTGGVYDVKSATTMLFKFLSSPAGKRASFTHIFNILKNGFRKVHHKVGVSDLIGSIKYTLPSGEIIARALYVEIKTGSDKESKVQKKFREDQLKNGAIAFVFSDQEVNFKKMFPIEKALKRRLDEFK